MDALHAATGTVVHATARVETDQATAAADTHAHNNPEMAQVNLVSRDMSAPTEVHAMTMTTAMSVNPDPMLTWVACASANPG